jgi:thiamine-monophosphate kinase
VYVTGTLGDAAVGLQQIREALEFGAERASGARVDRYLRPDPRVRAGALLGRNRAASSCMDVSDGLADCVRQVAEASGVGMIVDAAAIPLSDEVRVWQTQGGKDVLEPALSGGDDYELFFTVRPAHRGRLRAVCQQLGDLPITRIGVVTKARDLLLRHEGGHRALPAGYEHFK